MQVGFICPDGVKIKHGDCLAKCRLERCATVSMLTKMADIRKWKGKPSTTMVIGPTRLAYLRVKCDYYESPQGLIFSFLGTGVHGSLEKSETVVSILEKEFENEEITGIADCYETENGISTLTDYKVWGAYRVAQSLGIKTVRKKLGQKWVSEIIHDTPSPDALLHETMQLNRYRMFFEDAKLNADKLQLGVFVRDAGLAASVSKGVTQNFYLIPIDKLGNSEVDAYMRPRLGELTKCLECDIIPSICSEEERWMTDKGFPNRCMRFCPVWEYCDYGVEEHNIEPLEE